VNPLIGGEQWKSGIDNPANASIDDPELTGGTIQRKSGPAQDAHPAFYCFRRSGTRFAIVGCSTPIHDFWLYFSSMQIYILLFFYARTEEKENGRKLKLKRGQGFLIVPHASNTSIEAVLKMVPDR
jgi:hypothetical protein